VQRKLYDSFYINFTSTLSRNLLEDLAQSAVISNSTHLITQIYDQYLNYICLDKNLFSLEMPKSYSLIHDPTTPESTIEKTVEQIAVALFSVIVTLGTKELTKGTFQS
jgi:sec1 family domain-containing protein 1